MNDASAHDAHPVSRSRLDSPRSGRLRRGSRSAPWRFLGIVVTAIALLVGTAIPAAAAELMRITFVRHGESAGNASGLIDTSTPGPVLTELGRQQAQAVVGTLGDNNYDAIYSSTMVRTQLTAAPMSQYLRLPIQVLPGLQEIEAGIYEGTPESGAESGYAQAPLAWTFQGNRDVRIPGSINGHEFDARVDGALKTMYDKGDRNAVVFSHGGTIMFWTMMNVQNLTLQQKIQLLSTARLDNTDYVVIEGNPEDGWTLVNWNGQQFSPKPTLAAELRLQIRTLVRQLTATANQVAAAFASRDIGTILTAINRGVTEAAFSIAKFGRTVNAKIIDQFTKPAPSAPAPESPEVAPAAAFASEADTADTLAAAVAADDDKPAATRVSSSETAATPESVDPQVSGGTGEEGTEEPAVSDEDPKDSPEDLGDEPTTDESEDTTDETSAADSDTTASDSDTSGTDTSSSDTSGSDSDSSGAGDSGSGSGSGDSDSGSGQRSAA